MQKLTIFLLTILLLASTLVLGQRRGSRTARGGKTTKTTKTTKPKELTVDEYINLYKQIAIQEMERSGIPASITLAQGIHESAFGNSMLAQKAKNHFGIKCTKDWKGGREYKWDDEIRKSCFRVYQSAEESYVDHTDFLLNRKHYAFLFKFDRKDYKSWARGLRKAGYATDPKYPEKLIKTIEKYKLAQYDSQTGILTYDTTGISTKGVPLYSSKGRLRNKPRSFLFTAYKAGFYRQNSASHAVARKGESALALAKRFGIPYKRFLKFNDLKDGDRLIDYQPAYIQPKRSTYRGSESFHRVEKDATMYEIAQYYGIRLESLLELNLMKEGEQPKNGELILLKETALAKPKLRPANHIDTLPSPYIDDPKSNVTNQRPKTIATPVKVVIPKVERPKPQNIELNTPTYDNSIYADTARINTATSKNKEYLNTQVTGPTASNTGAGTTVVRRPGRTNPATNSNTNTNTNSNTTINRRPSNTNSTNNTNTQSNSNTSGTNPNALFPPQGNTNSNPNPNPNTNTNPTTNPNNSIPNSNTLGTKNTYKNTGGTTNLGLPNEPKPNTPPVTNTPPPNITPPPAATNTANVVYHVVQGGETLYRIHKKYGVPVEAIQAANSLTDTNIKEGSKLKIPVK